MKNVILLRTMCNSKLIEINVENRFFLNVFSALRAKDLALPSIEQIKFAFNADKFVLAFGARVNVNEFIFQLTLNLFSVCCVSSTQLGT